MEFILDHLNTLEDSGLIHLVQAEPDLEYIFRHALIRDATYASLLKADRRVLHLAVGEALERLYPDRLHELASTLGRHFYLADDVRAAKYYSLAGDFALSKFANVEAESHYRTALELTRTDSERARLLSVLGEALFMQSRFENALGAWREAIRLYQSLEDYDGVARSYARSAQVDVDSGQQLALCQEGLTAIAGKPETPAMALLFHESARAFFFTGLYQNAFSLCQQAVGIAERQGNTEALSESLCTLGLLLTATGQCEQANNVMTKAVKVAEAAGELRAAGRAHHNLGDFLFSSVGDLPAAANHLLHAADIYKRMGLAAREFYSLDSATLVLLRWGDLATAEKTLIRLRKLMQSVMNTGDSTYSLMLKTDESLLLKYRGQIQAAVDGLLACLIDARQARNRFIQYLASYSLAESLLELGRVEEAKSILQEAIDIGKRSDPGTDMGTGNHVWPRCLLCMTYAQEQKFEEAKRLLDEARTRAKPQPTAVQAHYLLLAEARLAVTKHAWSEALIAFAAATEIQSQTGERWFRAQTVRAWAEAYLNRGEQRDQERARELLGEARAIFDEMGAEGYAASVNERLELLANSGA